jgi:hypothetical protein
MWHGGTLVTNPELTSHNGKRKFVDDVLVAGQLNQLEQDAVSAEPRDQVALGITSLLQCGVQCEYPMWGCCLWFLASSEAVLGWPSRCIQDSRSRPRPQTSVPLPRIAIMPLYVLFTDVSKT